MALFSWILFSYFKCAQNYSKQHLRTSASKFLGVSTVCILIITFFFIQRRNCHFICSENAEPSFSSIATVSAVHTPVSTISIHREDVKLILLQQLIMKLIWLMSWNICLYFLKKRGTLAITWLVCLARHAGIQDSAVKGKIKVLSILPHLMLFQKISLPLLYRQNILHWAILLLERVAILEMSDKPVAFTRKKLNPISSGDVIFVLRLLLVLAINLHAFS